MREQKVLDLGWYEEMMKNLVREIETARWAVYEIKSNSETGEILKHLITLISLRVNSRETVTCNDAERLKGLLISSGYDKDLVDKIIARLFKNGPLH